ncbi:MULTISPECIES: P22 phage major capsid protein family protein [Atopobium]|uniref:P22 coat protein n=1 Tax=Atopobium minutum 10063974 TaxID=997872 RepID=N2C0K7_9ACTN|nr:MULTISPECIES: P22 phage major capsid protein family protein [Atopobium]EMZ42704.1 hypothetical protein HMPREF1091_00262 [Atopobium minutum 10063974]ERL15397.1 coat protein, P22 domain protein [Atopobium sp. BV3Ac4]
MANTILTSDVIAGEALDILRNNAVLPNLVHRSFEPEFVAGRGDTINARKPASFVAKDYTNSITVQDVTETKIPVVMNGHKDVSIAVTSKEMTMSIEDFSAEILNPAMLAFVDAMDAQLVKDMVAGAKKTITAASTAVTQANIVDARAAITKAKAPLTERSFVFGTDIEADLLNTELFVNADKVGDDGTALREASLGRKFGMDCYCDQNCDVKTNECDGIVFHKNAVALVTAPLALPNGAAKATVFDFEGFSIRVVYGYDMAKKTDTISLDMLFGTKVLDSGLIAAIKRTTA